VKCRAGLRRPHKCQRRPTKGAKETYYMRTFESAPPQACPPSGYRGSTPSQEHSKFSSVSGFSGPEQLAEQVD
jgi:hypothetical protein